MLGFRKFHAMRIDTSTGNDQIWQSGSIAFQNLFDTIDTLVTFAKDVYRINSELSMKLNSLKYFFLSK